MSISSKPKRKNVKPAPNEAQLDAFINGADNGPNEIKAAPTNKKPVGRPPKEKDGSLVRTSISISETNMNESDDLCFYLRKASGNNNIKRSSLINHLLDILREEHAASGENSPLFKKIVKRLKSEL